MYGYFECDECDTEWESAHAYSRIKGSTDVADFYKQDCKDCGIGYKPYRVEHTVCSICGKTSRFCHCNKHNDPEKPHRSDLCEKCRSGRPCQWRR